MTRITQHDIDDLFLQQLRDWDLLQLNYQAIENVKTREFAIGAARFKVQFNPARITSSAAKVDDRSIKQRPCFLCSKNRPPEQKGLPWGNDYLILVNPYPIFPRHLTIPTPRHEPQRIATRIGDMMRLACDLNDFVIFYNGPLCGASAPDHAHFQAGCKDFMPFNNDLIRNGEIHEVAACNSATLGIVTNLARTTFIIRTSDIDDGIVMFQRLYEALPVANGVCEPMLNILCQTENGKLRIDVFPRAKHRPSCYYAAGESNILISPASVDMGGVLITPLEKDFAKITATDIKKILDEVCIDQATATLIINRIKS